MKTIIATLAIVAAFVFTTSAQSKAVQGVWQSTETIIGGPDGTAFKVSQPTLSIFTKKHYSFMSILGDTPRPDISERSPATPELMKEVFVDRFTANGGTYEVKDGKLTTHPSIAKSPSYMKAENFTVYSVEVKGNTMTLTSISDQSGPVKLAIVTKLVRVE